jgi:hypothetical protein
MRTALAAIMIALSLTAAPVQAKGPEEGFIASIPHDFMTGARFYFSTVGGWFATLFDLLGLTERLHIVGEDELCTKASRCSLGLTCVNVCDGADCDVYEKRCVRGPSSVDVLGVYSLCGKDDLCADGTACTRICPAGKDCGAETHRCLQPNEPEGACGADADCRALCGATAFLPIGPSGWHASCTAGACRCSPVVIDAAAQRVACPEGMRGAMACPEGTREACTPGADGRPYLTCVAAPAYGGTCFTDAGCADAQCPEGAAPFCDATDQRCRCRSNQVTTVRCSAPSDCQAAAVCGADEVHACIEGACACAPAGVITSCTAASDCSADCPEGFARACVEGQCACQRVTENVPVACQDVSQCGGVSCPAGYDKACIDAKCACTRVIPGG